MKKKQIISLVFIGTLLVLIMALMAHNAKSIDVYIEPVQGNNYANIDNPCANPDIVCGGEAL